MPATLTYPGVYIEEIPSSVRPITGVATSITAFVGLAERGPVSDPQTLTSSADYTRTFGAVSSAYPMSVAVSDFYQNEGRTAIVVRLTAAAHSGAEATIVLDTLTLQAADPGAWGNGLLARIESLPAPQGSEEADYESRFGVARSQGFNLYVQDTANGRIETYLNVALSGTRALSQVLESQSSIVRVAAAGPNPPAPTGSGSLNAVTLGAPFSAADANPVYWIPASGGVDSGPLAANDIATGGGLRAARQGIYALERTDLFNLLCIPATDDADLYPQVYQAAMVYCAERRAMLIIDPPVSWSTNPDQAVSNAFNQLPTLNLTGTEARNAAIYFPRMLKPDPDTGHLVAMPVCGAVAGVMRPHRHAARRVEGAGRARCRRDGGAGPRREADRSRERIAQSGRRQLPSRLPGVGHRRVGRAHAARATTSWLTQWKYVPVRRLALFIEESLYRGTQWVVFEPNDEPLWAADPAERRRVHADAVPPGRVPGHDAAAGLLRQVRRRDNHADRHRPRHRQHPRRLRAARSPPSSSSSRSSRSRRPDRRS